MFLITGWQLKYSSASEETQFELADVEIRLEKLLAVEDEGFSSHAMTEWLMLEGTCGGRLAQTPCSSRAT